MKETGIESYQDEVNERASENYNPYDYIYDSESDSGVESCIIDCFVWTVDK